MTERAWFEVADEIPLRIQGRIDEINEIAAGRCKKNSRSVKGFDAYRIREIAKDPAGAVQSCYEFLELFQDVVDATQRPTAAFRLAVLPAEKIQPANKRRSRYKQNAFKDAAKFNTKALVKMGLAEEEIVYMQNTGLTPCRDGQPLDVSYDHILPRSHGGGNEDENIQIIPEYLNNFLSHFVSIQIGAEHVDALTLRINRYPEPNVFPDVPILAGGFDVRPSDKQAFIKNAMTLINTPVFL